MSMRRHIGFGSTPNWGNCYKEVRSNQDSAGRLAFANYDPTLGEPPTEDQKELLQSYIPEMPTIIFTGSEKLHGENMAVCYSNEELWVQGRSQVRTLLGDQNGMVAFVDSTSNNWKALIEGLALANNVDLTTHTLVIDCEWAGGSIQRGNSACSGTNKGAYIFDYFRVVNNDTNERQSYSTRGLKVFPDKSIYLMSSFNSYEIVLDFAKPEECETKLKELAELVEAKSPIAEYHNKPDNVGEGVYLYGKHDGITYRLKTKGEKHGGKPKIPRTPKVIDTELETKLIDLANDVTPVWRITQAITEIGATEMKHIGEVIKWVMQDIAKEEMPKLHSAGVELKQLGRYTSKITKDYYIDFIKGY